MINSTTAGLIEHAKNAPGEYWEFECNDVGDDALSVPRINYTEDMYGEMYDLIGNDWVGVYSLYERPFPAHQTRKMVKDLVERGLVETRMVVAMRKTLMVRRVK